MSKTNLSAKDKRTLYFKCGGRCSRCCTALDYDAFSRTKTATEEHAHIIGDSEFGPRGSLQSTQLAAEINNIIILCPTCHTVVDKEVSYYTVERLHYIKSAHEMKVTRLLDSLKNESAQIVKYASKIGSNVVNLDDSKIDEAVRESGYYASRIPTDLNPSHTAFSDSDVNFWQSEWEQLKSFFEQTIGEERKKGQACKILLFALAPIPLLIRLGMLFGDLSDVFVYQKRREPDTWVWDSESIKTDLTIIEPDQCHGIVAIKLSLSDKISDDRIHSVLGDDVSIWELTHDNPNNDFLQHPNQLSTLRTSYRELFQRIREKHGQNTKIHVFPACPTSAAVEFGRTYMPKADAQMLLYDQNWSTGRFNLAFDLS